MLFVSYKNIKALIADLKLAYKAATEESALLNLELFDEKWTSRQRDWGQMISQFQIYFEGRI